MSIFKALLREVKGIMNRRDRYNSFSLRYTMPFQTRRNDVSARDEHASFDPVDRSPTSRLSGASLDRQTSEAVRGRRKAAIERERSRRRTVHRRKPS